MPFRRLRRIAAIIGNIQKRSGGKRVRRYLTGETLDSRVLLSADIALLSSTPADGNPATSVASDITLVFNQDVQVGNGAMTIRDSAGTVVQTILMSDHTKVQVIGNQVSVNPGTDLNPLASYSVQFDSNAVRTLDGYYWNGIQNTTDLNFTTGNIIFALTRRGNDNTNGNGSSGTPWQSLGYASTRAIPGDTIYVSITDSSGNALTSSTRVTVGYDIKSAGTAASPIVIKPNPNGSRQYRFSSYNALAILGTHTIIEGFEFDGDADSIPHYDLLRRVWDFKGTVDDTVYPVGDIAINVKTGQYITLRDNYFHDLVQKAINIEGGRYVNVFNNIIDNVATTSLSGGHGIMRQQGPSSNFSDPDVSGQYRWDIYGNLLQNVEQRIYSWVPSKGYMNMTLDEGKPINIDETTDTQMIARIAQNIVAYAAIDAIRLKTTPNLTVEQNSIFSYKSHADGITDSDTVGRATPFPGMKITNNLVQTGAGTVAFELNDAFPSGSPTGTSSISGNIRLTAGGGVNPANLSGVSASVGVGGNLFVNPMSGDFTPISGLEGVGVECDRTCGGHAMRGVGLRNCCWNSSQALEAFRHLRLSIA